MISLEEELRVCKTRLDISLQSARCFREKKMEVSAVAVEETFVFPLRRRIAKIEADIAAGGPTTVHPRVVEREIEKQREIEFAERAARAAEAGRDAANGYQPEPDEEGDEDEPGELEDGEPF